MNDRIVTAQDWLAWDAKRVAPMGEALRELDLAILKRARELMDEDNDVERAIERAAAVKRAMAKYINGHV